MKKKFCLVLAVFMVLALFSACSGGGGTTTTQQPTATATAAGNNAATAAPTTAADDGGATDGEEVSDYNYAVGKYDIGADGIATQPYDYTLPLTTAGDVLELWNVCFTPAYIPEEGFGEMPYQTELRNKTGVNVEYIIINSETRNEAFQMLLAADDLPDMMGHGFIFYGKSARNAIDEGFFVNLYDYKDYMPNFLYQVKAANDFRLTSTIYYDSETIVLFYGIVSDPTPAQGYCVRGDWLERVGLNADEIITYDDVYNMLTLFKTELGAQWPMEVFFCIELVTGVLFAGFDVALFVSETALPHTRVVDGELQFMLTMQDDLDALTVASQWFKEGLIDPGYAAYQSNDAMAPMISTNQAGYAPMNPSQAVDFEMMIDDPNAVFVALPRPLKYEGQVLEYGQKISSLSYGSISLSTKCPNIELAVTWNDYFYSPEGSEFGNWGVEGHSWEYNENGEKQLTEFITNNPDGFSAAWLLQMHTAGNLVDAFLATQYRSYAYEGGERLYEMFQIWTPENYSGKCDVPGVISLTDEESNEVANYKGDIITYISEHYMAFFEGSRPLSDWNDYIAGLENIGLTPVLEIYRDAYARLLDDMAALGFSA